LAPQRLPHSEFVYAVCQVGAEVALKAEVARSHAEWHSAFSRPGLVTWKLPEPVSLEFAFGAVLARCHGLSLGRAAAAAEVVSLLEACIGDAPFALHVFERDRYKPGDEPASDPYGPAAEAARSALLSNLQPQLLKRALQTDDLVLDIVVAPDEPWVVGLHRHSATRSPFPGARPSLTLPKEAPSRAWLKLEEGLRFAQLFLEPGDTAVEIGSAPGGASYALLQRGLKLIGVDPAAMAAEVLGHPAFKHVQVKLGDLRREQLPKKVDWLFLDVNLAPAVALHQLSRVVSTLKSTLKGGLFTLKLNDWSMVEQVPAFLSRLQAMGFVDVRARQLCHNRQEICVAVRTKRAA
jgi:23S rRNA (cytidine2498-2'-O)-methyltransferase